MTNFAVVGLGYGDEGKGGCVDWLCRNRDVRLVVRHNGGAQAGHNVVTEDGRHHTFAQWGSGTLAGVPTFLSRFMVVDPLALVPEAEHLQSIGVEDPWSMLTVDPEALVVTPWHRAAQRFDEKLRGAKRHGTCGMGIGKAVEESLKYPDRVLRWGDLVKELEEALERAWTGKEYASPLTMFMRRRFQDHSLASMENSDGEHPWARQPDEVAKAFVSIAQRVRTSSWVDAWSAPAEDPPLAKIPGIVFEGAQGVLLDEWYGFHPHTTWSTCTFENAVTLAAEAGMDKPYRLGVTRSYSVRHGPGPFPTEDGTFHDYEPHNSHDEWRGDVRYGPLDLVLLRYAAEACRGVNGVAMTHMDRFNRRVWSYVPALEGPTGRIERIPVPSERDLGRQEALGRWLEHARPAEGTVAPTEAFLREAVAAAQASVVLESYGPTAADRKDVGLP